MALRARKSPPPPTPLEVAEALATALHRRGIQFHWIEPGTGRNWGWRKRTPTGFYVINGQPLAPWQAANAYLPGGWRGFYAQVMGRGGGR